MLVLACISPNGAPGERDCIRRPLEQSPASVPTKARPPDPDLHASGADAMVARAYLAAGLAASAAWVLLFTSITVAKSRSKWMGKKVSLPGSNWRSLGEKL